MLLYMSNAAFHLAGDGKVHNMFILGTCIEIHTCMCVWAYYWPLLSVKYQCVFVWVFVVGGKVYSVGGTKQ